MKPSETKNGIILFQIKSLKNVIFLVTATVKLIPWEDLEESNESILFHVIFINHTEPILLS